MNLVKRILLTATAVALTASLLAGCNSGGKVTQLGAPKKGQQIATMTVKDFGDIKIKLFPDEAPKTVENFTTHAKNGYYDGLTFHRVMKDFMIQGGDPSGNGTGGESIWGDSFKDEFSDKLRNFTGALSMANSGPDTNGSQFFIVNTPKFSDKELENYNTAVRAQFEKEPLEYSDEDKKTYTEIGGTPWLDYGHTVFGQVYEGLDIVAKIMAVEVGANDLPTTPVVIEKIVISVAE